MSSSKTNYFLLGAVKLGKDYFRLETYFQVKTDVATT